MKSSLLTLAALVGSLLTLAALAGGATAIVLPSGSTKPLPRAVPDLPMSSSPLVVRPAESAESLSVPLQSVRRRDFGDFEQTKAFARGQADRLLRRYGSPQQKRNAQLEKRHAVGLTNGNIDTIYYAQVSIGTPAQNFLLQLDTGSSDLWVMDDRCGEQCDGSPLFNRSASSTYIGSEVPFSIQYGEGRADGKLAADTVSVAGYQVQSLSFGVIDEADESAATAPSSGLMGLGFREIADSLSTPFWEVLARSGQLQEPVFTLQLSRQRNNPDLLNADDRFAPGGVLTFGTIDPEQFSGPISYSNVSGNTWSIPMDSFTINGKKVTLQGAQRMSLIDTGVASIGGPPDIIKEIYAQILGSRIVNLGASSSFTYYAVPCNASPSVSLSFGGKEWTLNPTDFTTGASARRDYPGSRKKGELECVGAFFATTLETGSAWLVGDTFMKNVFQVYDGGFGRGPARIGFAALKGPTAQTIATTTGTVQTKNLVPAASRTQTITSATAPSTQPTQPAEQSTGPNGIVGGTGLPAPSLATIRPTATASLMSGINYPSLDIAAAKSTTPASTRNTGVTAARSGSSFILAVGIAAGLAALVL